VQQLQKISLNRKAKPRQPRPHPRRVPPLCQLGPRISSSNTIKNERILSAALLSSTSSGTPPHINQGEPKLTLNQATNWPKHSEDGQNVCPYLRARISVYSLQKNPRSF